MFKECQLKTLKMTSVCLFETLVNIYRTTRCYNSGDQNMNLLQVREALESP